MSALLTLPENAVLVALPYSEVCMHMRVAGKHMWVAPVGDHMAQLYDEQGRKFSMPITRGEAGIFADPPLVSYMLDHDRQAYVVRGKSGAEYGAFSYERDAQRLCAEMCA